MTLVHINFDSDNLKMVLEMVRLRHTTGFMIINLVNIVMTGVRLGLEKEHDRL